MEKLKKGKKAAGGKIRTMTCLERRRALTIELPIGL
jgi:hypothetical protein